VALFRATSAYRIRPSGLFPSGQPHASRRRCFLAVGVSSGYPPPSSPLLFLARRFEVLPVKPFPKPPQAALNIIFDAHSQDCKASRRAVAHQLKALALVPYCRTVTTRAAPSPIVPKSVDPRLRSFAPPGHPYFNHRVNGDRSRCPPDLFPSEVSHPGCWFPSPHAVTVEPTRSFKRVSPFAPPQGLDPTRAGVDSISRLILHEVLHLVQPLHCPQVS
jgi:hypothetical protein